MTFADSAARARIRDDLDATLLVEAAAGTGKTTALLGRIVNLIRSGRTSLDRIVAVTFTEKAAGEMKLRLRGELEQARQHAVSELERGHLEHALAALELAHINTIHGFCADLLKERPVEARVDPRFEVLDEAAADRLLQQAFAAWFERVLGDPPEGVRRALRRGSWKSERMGPREELLQACRALVEHRDFGAPWSSVDYDRKAGIDAMLDRLSALGAIAAEATNPGDKLAQSLRFFGDFTLEVMARERARPRDHDGIEAQLVALIGRDEWKWKGGNARAFGASLERKDVLLQRDAAHDALRSLLDSAEADLAAQLQRELLKVVVAREALKSKAGGLDFVDLLLCTRDLLKNDPGVLLELQNRFTHICVDEFQDADPLQAEILLRLAADGDDPSIAVQRPKPGKLFVVGDPKQAIYRFRRADVMFYERIKARLLDGGAELLHLTTSFRSVPELQNAVNVSFSRLMTGSADGSQAEYVALSPYRSSFADQPAVVALPVPEPYGWRGYLTKTAVQASFPDAATAFVAWLLNDSGWTVEEAGQRTALEARHVCLLFRRFLAFGEDMTRGYVRGLEARRVPHVLVGGRSLHNREEVMALRAALTAIEWPDDELNVYATLHGPFFAIADDELLCFRHELGRLHPLRRFDDQAVGQRTVADALAVLGRLHRSRNRRPIADTIGRLFEETRAHAGFAIWPTGEQALANVLALSDAARTFELRGATSFRGFVDWLDDQSERGEGSEAPIVEEGTEGVRLMTIHKAKGLEFPVVVLCDPTASIAPSSASRYVDSNRGLWAQRICGCRPHELLVHEPSARRHDEAENVRLAYVAATRARDLLVVPVFGDAQAGSAGIGWVDMLAPAVYPSDASRRAPQNAPGCPGFGDDSVMLRPAQAHAMPGSGVMPGLHSGFGGETAAVWWDPGVLKLGAQPIGGVRQQELLRESEHSPEWTRAHEAWRDRRTETIARASEPAIVARPITGLAAERAVAAVAQHDRELLDAAAKFPGLDTVAIARTEVERDGRPRGARFGSLVHAVLAHVPLTADAAVVETVAAAQARIIGATQAELEAAVKAASAALTHPLLARATSALDCRREVPVALRLDNGTIAEGVIDLVFREQGRWVVVDFKTDAELRDQPAYTEQVRLYVEAVRTATGESAQGVLLAV